MVTLQASVTTCQVTRSTTAQQLRWCQYHGRKQWLQLELVGANISGNGCYPASAKKPHLTVGHTRMILQPGPQVSQNTQQPAQHQLACVLCLSPSQKVTRGQSSSAAGKNIHLYRTTTFPVNALHVDAVNLR